MDDTMALLTNEYPELSLVVTSKFRLDDACEFGAVSNLFQTPPLGAEMTLYGHVTSRDDIPTTTLRAYGEVELNIAGAFGVRATTEILVDSDGGLAVTAEMDTLINGVPVIPLRGDLQASGGLLKGKVGFSTVETRWGSKFDFSIEAEMGAGADPYLAFDGGLTFTSGLFDSTTSFPVSGRLEKDGDRLALVLCLHGAVHSEKEIEAIARIGAGGDNCIDWSTLIQGIPNGGQCFDSGMCASGRCEFFDDFRVAGTCRERLPQGSKCDADLDCSSGRCEIQFLQLKATCLGTLPIGSHCSDSSDCQSGRCDGGVLGLGSKCQERLPQGSFCTRRTDCESLRCDLSFSFPFRPKCS